MADKTYIVNLAAIRLGCLPLLDLDSDTSKKGLVFRTVYDEALKLALVDHPWGFATKRAILAQENITPAFGYAYSYAKPSDCLRILGLCDTHHHRSDVNPELIFRMEGGHLLTNQSTVWVKYIALITNEGMFSPGFVSAFAYHLAAEAAYGITGNGSLKTEIMNEYVTVGLPKAKALDSQEGVPELFETNPWIAART